MVQAFADPHMRLVVHEGLQQVAGSPPGDSFPFSVAGTTENRHKVSGALPEGRFVCCGVGSSSLAHFAPQPSSLVPRLHLSRVTVGHDLITKTFFIM
jgi:hypothetical protein